MRSLALDQRGCDSLGSLQCALPVVSALDCDPSRALPLSVEVLWRNRDLDVQLGSFQTLTLAFLRDEPKISTKLAV